MTSATKVLFYDGATAHDLDGEVTDVTFTRGRMTEFDDVQAAVCNIGLHNITRDFDPFFVVASGFLLQTSGDYLTQTSGDRIIIKSSTNTTGQYGPMTPGRKIVVQDSGVTILTGQAEDYTYAWEQGRTPLAGILASDALAKLGRTDLTEHTPTKNQLPGARIAALLNRAEVAFPTGASNRDIDDGLTPLLGNLVSLGTKALAQLHLITRSDFGRLYVARLGALSYQDRNTTIGASIAAQFDDTETNIPFHAVQVRAGSERLHHQVTVQRADGDISVEGDEGPVVVITNPGVAKTTTNTDAIAADPGGEIRPLSITGLLCNHDAYSQSMSEYLADRLARGRAIVEGLTVNLTTLTSAQRAAVTALDIGQVVTLNWTPTGTGNAVAQTLVIEGTQYAANITAGTASMGFRLTEFDQTTYWTLEDSVLGIIDDDDIVLMF